VFGNWSRQVERGDFLSLYTGVLNRLQSSPGVASAAITNAVPLAEIVPFEQRFLIEGRHPDQDRLPTTDQNIASPGYFSTLGVPLLRGRDFTDADRAEAPRVAIINQSMARSWSEADPIGTRFSLDDGRTWITVIGLVSDVRQYGLERAAIAQCYTPLQQIERGLGGRVLVRAQGDPLQVAALITEAVHRVDPQVAVENVKTLETLKAGRLATPRVTALLLAIFAGLALLMTVAGLGGVIATSVNQRTHEFGVRLALGATRRTLLGLVLRQGLALVGTGLVLGAVGSLMLSRILSSHLFETTPTDPLTLASVSAVFLVAGLAACLVPARRATTIDPLVALRTE
jgi:predicted permease